MSLLHLELPAFYLMTDLALRLATLRSEYNKGHQRLTELRREEAEVRQTLLRIEGAMMVLEEMVAPEGPHSTEENMNEQAERGLPTQEV
ncbi:MULTISPECIES: hypothetical protein [unclassified Cyanobium]|uniref:hypothetical protein n=1 Tax=unclassified Cyanobium TaxID=2627006 RepID=UPI0020CCE297|nr:MULTISPECIES: hypothetical protein [unclassified Cyanobium]MCP9835706.1 hypothetical protein [Cyanobium sp. La Preciosa 7G6]MCP9938469.1 hypothetical protein [Cyanobium sp. Aljojuca 7A6]